MVWSIEDIEQLTGGMEDSQGRLLTDLQSKWCKDVCKE